jgi:hypothetical protein
MKSTYSEILIRAQFEVSYSVRKSIEKVRHNYDIDYRTEEEKKSSALDELICKIAFDLWKQKKFGVLENYRTYLQKESDNSYPKADYIKLCEIKRKMDICKNEKNKIIWYAKGFAEIYYFEEAILIVDELIANNILTKKKEIELRKLLSIWYMESDINKSKERENYLKLILLNPEDKDLCKSFFKLQAYKYNDQEKIAAINILKKHGTVKEWEWLKEGTELNSIVFLELFEAVRPIRLFSKDLIQFVIDEYIENNMLKKAQKTIKDIKANKLWDDDLSCSEAKIYFCKEQYDEAEKILMKVLSENDQSICANFYMGHILSIKDKYEDALIFYEKYHQKSGYGVENIIWCDTKLGNNEKAEKIFSDWYISDKFSYYDLYLWIARKLFPKEFVITCINNITISYTKKSTLIGSVEKVIYHLLNVTKCIQGKGKIQYNLIELYILVTAIKQTQQLDVKNIAEIYHYSTLDSLNYLAKYDGEKTSPYLRLNNVAYMNDPMEGNSMFEIINDRIKDIRISKIYERITEHENFTYRNKYLACFSMKKDMLPMWVQYANNGQGCCYSIDTNIFQNFDSSIEKHILGKNYDELSDSYMRINEEEDYLLYNVFYYEKNDNSKIINLCLEIGKVLLELYEAMDIPEVGEIIMGLLDEVRYLFKDSAYKTECEVRVIGMDYNNKKKAYRPNNCRVPHLYLDLEKKLSFKEIILGPKVENISELTAYLNCCSNVEKISKSLIKYN